MGVPFLKAFAFQKLAAPAAIILLSPFFMSVIMSRALRLLFFHDFVEFDKRFHDIMFNISFAIIAKLQRKSCFIKGEERIVVPNRAIAMTGKRSCAKKAVQLMQ